jgi:hypothetical protein
MKLGIFGRTRQPVEKIGRPTPSIVPDPRPDSRPASISPALAAKTDLPPKKRTTKSR